MSPPLSLKRDKAVAPTTRFPHSESTMDSGARAFLQAHGSLTGAAAMDLLDKVPARACVCV